jgi:hypothetical protein
MSSLMPAKQTSLRFHRHASRHAMPEKAAYDTRIAEQLSEIAFHDGQPQR